MAKKSFGKMMVFAAITGAAIGAGLYYLKKYKSFNEELEEEFLDVEGDDEEEEPSEEETRAGEMETVEAADIDSEEENKDTADDTESVAEDEEEAKEELADASDAKRKYIPLNVNTDKLKAAAKDTGEKAMDALKDGFSIISAFAHDAAPVVKDKVNTLKTKANEKIETYKHAKDKEDSETDLYEEDEETSVSFEESESSDTEETVSDVSGASDIPDASDVPKQEPEEKEEPAEAESTIAIEEPKE